jgi:hypothetical protein
MKKRNRSRGDVERKFMNAVSVLKDGMNYNTLGFGSFTVNLSNHIFLGCRHFENRANIRRFIDSFCPHV